MALSPEKISVALDFAAAEKATEDFNNQFVANIKDAVNKGVAEFQQFRNASDDDLKKLAITAQQESKKFKASLASFANEARGFAGDAADMFGIVGKGFLGMSDAALNSADKMLTAGEKLGTLGGAIGKFFGPIGETIGTFAGMVAGGVMGYFTAQTENAAEALNKQVEASARAAENLRIYREQIEKLISTQKGLDDLAESARELQIQISDTLNPEDLSKKSKKELEESAKVWKDNLETLQFSAFDAEKRVKLLKEELESLKDAGKNNTSWIADVKDAFSGKGLASQIVEKEKELAQETENLGKTTKEAAKATSEFQKIQGVLNDRLSKGKKEVKDYTAELKKLNESALGSLQRNTVEKTIGLLESATSGLSGRELGESVIGQIGRDALEANKEIDKLTDSLLGAATAFQMFAGITKEDTAFMKESFKQIGQVFSNAIGSVATDAFNSWLETVATGERDADRSFKKIAASAVRNIGAQLVADGVKNVLQGVGMAIINPVDPRGSNLTALGAAEIAAGVGMGAAGAKAQRRQGYGSERNEGAGQGTLGRSSNTTSGTKVQAPTIVNLGLLAVTDQRQLEQAGKQIAQATKAYQQGR